MVVEWARLREPFEVALNTHSMPPPAVVATGECVAAGACVGRCPNNSKPVSEPVRLHSDQQKESFATQQYAIHTQEATETNYFGGLRPCQVPAQRALPQGAHAFDTQPLSK